MSSINSAFEFFLYCNSYLIRNTWTKENETFGITVICFVNVRPDSDDCNVGEPKKIGKIVSGKKKTGSTSENERICFI